jgi:glutamate dehydrogenase
LFSPKNILIEDGALRSTIQKVAATETDLQVFESFVVFNKHVLQTNFFLNTKVALSFLLDPHYLQGMIRCDIAFSVFKWKYALKFDCTDSEYPDMPFAVYMVVGSEFRGFHVRYRELSFTKYENFDSSDAFKR